MVRVLRWQLTYAFNRWHFEGFSCCIKNTILFLINFCSFILFSLNFLFICCSLMFASVHCYSMLIVSRCLWLFVVVQPYYYHLLLSSLVIIVVIFMCLSLLLVFIFSCCLLLLVIACCCLMHVIVFYLMQKPWYFQLFITCYLPLLF